MSGFSSKTILVTGGAGYIASHVLLALKATGAQVVVLDNLSTGRQEAVLYGELVVGDLSDIKLLTALFERHQFDAVMHFAGKIVVPESIDMPLMYYHENTQHALQLMLLCKRFSVKHFIFSSTAAVYGMPQDLPIGEDHLTAPISPYGQSKLMVEHILRDYAFSNSDFSYVALRYFNVAGSAYQYGLGQAFSKATHLIKVACQVALKKRSMMQVYGQDYDTPDGSCIRDYIHVQDLADAHVLALAYLFEGGSSQVMNCGYGRGFSVKEVLAVLAAYLGEALPIHFVERRAGDPAALVAKADRIRAVLSWQPKYDDLAGIVESAYLFEKQLS